MSAAAQFWIFAGILVTSVVGLVTQILAHHWQTATLAGIAKTGEKVHVLVNGRLGIALENYAQAIRELALLTGSERHVALAEITKKASLEYNGRQEALDKQAL